MWIADQFAFYFLTNANSTATAKMQVNNFNLPCLLLSQSDITPLTIRFFLSE